MEPLGICSIACFITTVTLLNLEEAVRALFAGSVETQSSDYFAVILCFYIVYLTFIQ